MKLLVDYEGLFVEAEIILEGFEEKTQNWTPDFSEILCDDFIKFPTYEYPCFPIVSIDFLLSYVNDLQEEADSYNIGNASDFLGDSNYSYYYVTAKTRPIDYGELVYLYHGDDVERKAMIIDRLKKFSEY